MPQSKVYSRINWVNEEEPALNETNLNKVDYALDVIDDRVVELDITKAKQSDLNESLKTLTFDQETGVFTFEYWNGSQLICDINVEKIPVSFSLSDEGILKMVTDDGTEWTCDISKLIKSYSFLNSDTINFEDTVDENGNHNITAKVKMGSITDEHLHPNYLADITKQANLSKESSENSKSSSLVSEGFAKGTQNGEPVGEDSEYYNNNAEYFKNQAQSMSNIGNGLIKVKQGDSELGSFTTNQSEDTIINIPESTNIEVDSELSSTSENPVQNKVVTQKLGTINEDLMSKVDLPKKEDGSVDFGEKGKVLSSNGDGTYFWGKGGGGSSIYLGDVIATVTPLSRSAKLIWSDPNDVVIEDITLASWGGTLVVRKEDSAPESVDDGVIVVDSTVRNQYSSEGFIDTGLENGKTYYYRFFPYTKDYLYTDGYSTNVVPERYTINEQPTVSGSLTYNGSEQSPTLVGYDSEKIEISGDASGTNAGEYTIIFTPTIDYKWSDGTIDSKEVNWVIDKAQPTISLSESSVTLNDTTLSNTVTATCNSGGTLSVSSNNTSIATASIDNGTITINSVNETDGTTTVTVNVTETDNYTSGSIDIVVKCEFLKIVTFATGTDEEIAKMVKAHYAGKIKISDYWTVGDKRTIHHNAMSANGVSESHHADDYEYIIIGIEHDDLVIPINGKTKAAITVHTERILYKNTTDSTYTDNNTANECGYMNSSNTNSGGWNGCARRTWCNNVYKACLPITIQNIMKQVKKSAGTGGGSSSGTQVSNDYAFLLAEIEIFGTTTYSVSGEGSQYQYFKNATSNRYKKPAYNSDSSAIWWERSPVSGDSKIFCSVASNGSASYGYARYAFGLAPCFCI